MNLELMGALNELEKERGISKAILFEAIEAAIVSAYKRNYGSAQNVRVEITSKGEMKVYARKDVVEDVLDEANEISLDAAKAVDPNYELDDLVEVEITPRDFGRIAAQTAKQVVIQRIREAERAMVFEEFQNREAEIVTGIVQRTEHRNVLVDLGKVEAVMPPSEQVPRETYNHGARMKVYVTEVRKTTKGPQVVVSRTHPGLLKRLFEFEVPEIHDGIVEIKAVAREAGNRSKIAVMAVDPNVDPVGACVGPAGQRVQVIVQELKGEKIDVVEWSPDAEVFIANSLSPARVTRVIILDGEKTARAVVPDHQLSLAIGKEGQNARLAARLCGWKIDIKSESQMHELQALEAKRLFVIPPKAEEDEEEVASVPTVASEEVPASVTQEPIPESVDLVESESAVVTPTVDDFAVESEEDELGDAATVVVDDLPMHEEEILDETDAIDETEITEELSEDEDMDVAYEEEFIDVIEEEPETPAAKIKKAKEPKRREIVKLLEEEDVEEELPSLFSEEEPTQVDNKRSARTDAAFYATGSVQPKKSTKEPARKESSKSDKKVVKDLSELAKLLDKIGKE
jgi:N utilization substance protein A